MARNKTNKAPWRQGASDSARLRPHRDSRVATSSRARADFSRRRRITRRPDSSAIRCTETATWRATKMIYEIVVEGFVLDVEVTHCINEPAQPNTWASDWDYYGTRELEYSVLSGITYDDDGVRMDCSSWELWECSQKLEPQITQALWVEIDARQRGKRWAA